MDVLEYAIGVVRLRHATTGKVEDVRFDGQLWYSNRTQPVSTRLAVEKYRLPAGWVVEGLPGKNPPFLTLTFGSGKVVVCKTATEAEQYLPR